MEAQDCQIALTCFHLADVALIEIAEVRKLLLGEPLRQPEPSYIPTYHRSYVHAPCVDSAVRLSLFH